MFFGLGPQGSNRKNSLHLFYSPKSCFFFVVVKKAMEAKLCLCLMLIILGTLTVQGALPRNNKKNPLQVFARQPPCECSFDPLMTTVSFYNFFFFNWIVDMAIKMKQRDTHRITWILRYKMCNGCFCCSHSNWNVICTVNIKYKTSSFSNLVTIPDEVCVITRNRWENKQSW